MTENTKQERNWLRTIVNLFWISMFAGMFYLIIIGGSLLDGFSYLHPIKDINFHDFDSCKEKDLCDTSNCVYSIISENFEYNESNQLKGFMSYEEFKIEGGVCKHFAILNKEVMKYLGYDGEIKEYLASGIRGHSFFIAHDKIGDYVIMDQIEPKCVYVG